MKYALRYFVISFLILIPFHPTVAGVAATVSSPFLYTFNTSGTLAEASSMSRSSSPYFWLNSGAYLPMQDGLGKTVQGALPAADPWRLLYATNNPLDTGNGYYPQNVFRLVTRSQWTNAVQEIQFKIQHTNLTDTPNRDGYSGVLFFSRYRDGDTLYYAGIRMDGMAVIKKKVGGTYYTLALTRVFPGTYDRQKMPTLLPQKQWMRMRLVTQDAPDGSVSLTLYLDKSNTGQYVEAARATDAAGRYGGTSVIGGPGYAGIRTDYQDIFFNDYKLTAL
jgi:hypothetical protein